MTATHGERAYHHGDLRRAIVATAMAMLQEGGDWQFTLREVARRAGVSHAAPYKHFPDKAALLGEVALTGFDQLRLALAATHAAASDGLGAEFAAMMRAYLAFGEANPALYRLMFGGAVANAADIHRDARAVGTFDLLVDLLGRGQAAGLFRERPVRGQAAACWAQLHGLTMLRLDGLLVAEKVGENAVDAALATLGEGLFA